MNVGIVTGYRIVNYGSVLQAYATQQVVNSLGYDSKLIRFENNKKDSFAYLSLLRNLCSFYHWGLRIEKIKLRKNRAAAPSKERRDKFDNFIRKHILETLPLSSGQELLDECKKYDILLAGSDQIWHPSNRPLHYYTLDFISNIKKISYASSFGVNKLPNQMKRGYKKALQAFDYITVREQSGVDIINGLGLSAHLVVDPTLLLSCEEWNSVVTEDIVNKNYIFCYFLGSREDGRIKALEMKRITGLPIIAICGVDDFIEIDNVYIDEKIEAVGPGEFLALIKGSKYVFTDSFHCSVFSIIFEKDFYVFKRFSDEQKISTNSRIENLLTMFDLNNRMCSADTSLTDLEEINYNFIQYRLEDLRMESKRHLFRALKGE